MLSRYQLSLKAKATHPFVKWVTLFNNKTLPDCKKLSGKVFNLDDAELRVSIEKHGGCGCRISPLPYAEQKRLKQG